MSDFVTGNTEVNNDNDNRVTITKSGDVNQTKRLLDINRIKATDESDQEILFQSEIIDQLSCLNAKMDDLIDLITLILK